MKVFRATFRWLFHAIAAMSLLLLIGTIALWIRAQSVSDMVTFQPGQKSVIIHVYRNCLAMEITPAFPVLPGAFPQYGRHTTSAPTSFNAQACFNSMYRADPHLRHVHFLGIHLFAWRWSGWNAPGAISTSSVNFYIAYVPFPWLILLWILPPATWLALYWRRRHEPGCCRKCGYNLRGSSGVCPECGTTTPSSPSPKGA